MECINLTGIRLRESGSFQVSPFVGGSQPYGACQASLRSEPLPAHLPASTAVISPLAGKNVHCRPRGNDFGDSGRRAVAEGLKSRRLLPNPGCIKGVLCVDDDRHESQSCGLRLMPHQPSEHRRRPGFSSGVFRAILPILDLSSRRSAIAILSAPDRRTDLPRERGGFFPARYTLLLRDGRVRRLACDLYVTSSPVCLYAKYTQTLYKIKTGFGDGGGSLAYCGQLWKSSSFRGVPDLIGDDVGISLPRSSPALQGTPSQ
jgi:hypothetical protein